MAIEHDLIHTISIKVAPALSHWDPPGCLNLQQMVVRGFASKKERECAFQSVHQLFQAPVHTFLTDITHNIIIAVLHIPIMSNPCAKYRRSAGEFLNSPSSISHMKIVA